MVCAEPERKSQWCFHFVITMGCNFSSPSPEQQKFDQEPTEVSQPPYKTPIIQVVKVTLPTTRDMRQLKRENARYKVTSKHWTENELTISM